ncbi:hypothetical protein K458DRAFT_400370 [Lentithecium fluviatile CBS 122367]|uniref:Uncharacterized protein n=1 Tax=Lentithecium fluviatile CBS 122367 TaxID=1168545 RepID=A0A6G1JGJ9_9PLEO|nr:hypothetical protein K458DRAFT_400370 [Lentithecium fluviatile CBS 122367]
MYYTQQGPTDLSQRVQCAHSRLSLLAYPPVLIPQTTAAMRNDEVPKCLAPTLTAKALLNNYDKLLTARVTHSSSSKRLQDSPLPPVKAVPGNYFPEYKKTFTREIPYREDVLREAHVYKYRNGFEAEVVEVVDDGDQDLVSRNGRIGTVRKRFREQWADNEVAQT